jgi:hypothetical protein
MRVLYIGNFLPEHSTENDVRRAFEHLGWTVDRCQEADFTRAMARARFSAIHSRALEADLVLHTMTQGSYPDPRRVTKLWDLCAERSIPTASIHLDLFYGLASPKDSGPQRQELPRAHPMFRVAHVFTADGGHDALWKRDGVNHHWLPPGVRHDEAIDVAPDLEASELGWKRRTRARERPLVGFAGSDGYHPEWPHRPQLVAWLRETYGSRFVHIGGSSTPRVTGLDLNRVFASVPVWVGDSCLTRPDFAYWSDRVPETWGRGGFLIHPRVDALNEHYGANVPGWEWECGDWTELRHEIDYWLRFPQTREEKRRNMAMMTRARDTYVQRVETMLDAIGFDREVSHAAD